VSGEFDLIARHFAPLAGPEGLGLLDDAAMMRPPPGCDLVLTTDANVVGVHVLTDEAPNVFARRLLRTNLSDLAAKGARPLGYLLTLALPSEADEAWVGDFASGLAIDQDIFDIRLFGGDTVSTSGPAIANIAMLGQVPEGRMLTRAGGSVGDDLYVTGGIGDGAFGLDAASGNLAGLSSAHLAYLDKRYRLPEPRLAFGQALLASHAATAAADVSDGLIADAGHIALASGCAVEFEAAAVPMSAAGAAVIAAAPDRWIDGLTGGDDYEIVFAAPPGAQGAIEGVAADVGLPVARIGRFVAGPAGQATLLDAGGRPMPLTRRGYEHR